MDKNFSEQINIHNKYSTMDPSHALGPIKKISQNTQHSKQYNLIALPSTTDTRTAQQDTPSTTPGAVPAPTSACDQQCTRIFVPVCGTDGKTYPNMCVLRAEDCVNREAGGSGVGLAFEAACGECYTDFNILPLQDVGYINIKDSMGLVHCSKERGSKFS